LDDHVNEAAEVGVLELVGKENAVDRDCCSRRRHIEVISHNGHSPLLAVLSDDVPDSAEDHVAKPISDDLVILRIAVESVDDLFPARLLCGCGLSDNAMLLTSHLISVRSKVIHHICYSRPAPYLH
jgi:hypothetical protein